MPEIDMTPTITNIYKLYGGLQKNRPHLGASIIGDKCARKLWFSFRHVKAKELDGKLGRLFDTGHREESRLLDELIQAGIEAYYEVEGKQIHYTDPINKHISGSLDGVGRGFEEAPETWHVIEIKTANGSNFDKLEKSGVKKAKPEHYAQMQVYMHWSGLKRAYYFVVCKNDDRIYGERVEYSKKDAESLLGRARIIVDDPNVPERFGGASESYPPCSWCDYRELCYGRDIADVNCRTCCHSTPKPDGSWYCEKEMDACNLCESHTFIPALVPLEMIGVDETSESIIYSTASGEHITNGEDGLQGEAFRFKVVDALL